MDEHNGQIGKLAFGRTVKTRRGYRPGEREIRNELTARCERTFPSGKRTRTVNAITFGRISDISCA